MSVCLSLRPFLRIPAAEQVKDTSFGGGGSWASEKVHFLITGVVF